MVFGGYIDSEGKSKSFISNGETYTTIDDSSGTSTGGRIAINDLGQVIGTYTTTIPFKNGFETHGFLYSNGTYTTIDDPSGTTYSLIAINNARQIIGLYQDSQHNLNSFFYSEGIYLTLAGPSGARTWWLPLTTQEKRSELTTIILGQC